MSDDISRPLGDWLREHREGQGISLEQVQADTRIRARYLEALEAEDLDALPNQVVARGFLRNYAAYLELDPQEAALRFEKVTGPSELKAPASEEPSPFATEPFRPVSLHEMPSGGGRRSRSRRWLPVAVAAVVLIALGFLGWQGYPYVADWLSSTMARVRPTATLPATRDALATATQTLSPTVTATVATDLGSASSTAPAPQAPTLALTWTPTVKPRPSLTPSPPVYTGIFLELVFTDTSWIQVTVDGVRQFQGELEAGTYRSWYGRERIELRIGNAGGVEVTVNGERLGTLGGTEDVVDRIFEIVDELVAETTPTAEPTTSNTPELTAPVPNVEVIPTGVITATPAVTPTAAITVTP